MANPYGITLDDASLRWAAAEGVPETVIAAVVLLHERSVGETVAKLRTWELEQVIKLVGRCPSCYPPGAYEALKEQRHRRSAAPPAPSVSPDSPPCQPAAHSPGTEDMHRTRARRYARLRLRRLEAHRSAVERAAATPTGQQTGTRAGTRGETARRRMMVEDLMKAGLSVRTISTGTGIPRSSVHRAMRAIARAEARREVAVLEIAKKLLGKRLRRRS